MLLAAVGLAGCQHGSDATATSYVTSCDKHDALSECNEYTAEFTQPRKSYLKKSCDVASGKFSETAGCTNTAPLVGRCELAGQRVWLFEDGAGAYTADSAKQRCKVIEGVWVPQR